MLLNNTFSETIEVIRMKLVLVIFLSSTVLVVSKGGEPPRLSSNSSSSSGEIEKAKEVTEQKPDILKPAPENPGILEPPDVGAGGTSDGDQNPKTSDNVDAVVVNDTSENSSSAPDIVENKTSTTEETIESIVLPEKGAAEV